MLSFGNVGRRHRVTVNMTSLDAGADAAVLVLSAGILARIHSEALPNLTLRKTRTNGDDKVTMLIPALIVALGDGFRSSL